MIPDAIRIAVAGRQDLAEAVAAPMVAAAHLCLASALVELRTLYSGEMRVPRRVAIVGAAKKLIRKWWDGPAEVEVDMAWVDAAMTEIAGSDEIDEGCAAGWSWRDYARGQWGGE